EVGQGRRVGGGPTPAAPADDAIAAGHFRVHPDLVGVHRALSEWMPELERAHHSFEEGLAAAHQGRHDRTQWRQELAVDRAPLFHSEKVHTQTALKEFLVALDDVWLMTEMGDAGVGCREEVIVDAQGLVGRVEESGTEIRGS